MNNQKSVLQNKAKTGANSTIQGVDHGFLNSREKGETTAECKNGVAQLVISPYTSRLNFNIVLAMSLAHRSAELLLYGFILLATTFYAACSIFGCSGLQKFPETIACKIIIFLGLSSFTLYAITEMRYILIGKGLLRLEKRDMRISATVALFLIVAISATLFLEIFLFRG